MPTKAKSAYGTKIKIGDGLTPETFTEIPEVGDIEGPGISQEHEDVTTHSSAASGANREFIPTLLTNTDCEFELNYDHTEPTHIALRVASQNRTKKNFQKVNPEGTETISFAAYVSEMAFADPVAGARKFPVTLKVTGGLTFA